MLFNLGSIVWIVLWLKNVAGDSNIITTIAGDGTYG